MAQEPTLPDIERTDFSFSLRGYDRAEVQAHLREVSEQMVEIQRDLRERAYAHLGEEMGQLLQHARDAADRMIADAETEVARLRSEVADEIQQLRATAQREIERDKSAAKKESGDLVAAARERVRVLRGSEREARQRMKDLSARLGELQMNLAGIESEPVRGLPEGLQDGKIAEVIDLSEAELSS